MRRQGAWEYMLPENLESSRKDPMDGSEADDDPVCLDESFFINNDYRLTTFSFGSQVLQLFCLQSASTDFDLTGQLVWPGAVLMNDYISKNAEMFQGCSAIELGSGVGVTGILCSRFCSEVVLTDHNDEVLRILQKNIEMQSSTECCGMAAERLEWGNAGEMNNVLSKYPGGFDWVIGADICFQQCSIGLLFETVERVLWARKVGDCKFLLSYVSRAKSMDELIVKEAGRRGMRVAEALGALPAIIYEITLPSHNHRISA